jgi:hypothetical protein
VRVPSDPPFSRSVAQYLERPAWDREVAGEKLVQIETNFTGLAVCDWQASQEPPRYAGTWFNFGEVPRLGDAEKSDWKFRTGFWPIEGLRGRNDAKHLTLHLSFETPFGAWTVRNATQLPGEKVLLQLGDNQVCVLDPNAKRVAPLDHGRGPIAVIPSHTNRPPARSNPP